MFYAFINKSAISEQFAEQFAPEMSAHAVAHLPNAIFIYNDECYFPLKIHTHVYRGSHIFLYVEWDMEVEPPPTNSTKARVRFTWEPFEAQFQNLYYTNLGMEYVSRFLSKTRLTSSQSQKLCEKFSGALPSIANSDSLKFIFDRDPEYTYGSDPAVPESILQHTFHRNQLFFLVAWSHCPIDDNKTTWEPYEAVFQTGDFIQDCEVYLRNTMSRAKSATMPREIVRPRLAGLNASSKIRKHGEMRQASSPAVSTPDTPRNDPFEPASDSSPSLSGSSSNSALNVPNSDADCQRALLMLHKARVYVQPGQQAAGGAPGSAMALVARTRG